MTRTVIVQDTIPPVLTLNSDDVMTVECGEPYLEPGAQVTDDCCPGPLAIGGDVVDTTTPGTYTVTYDAEDCSGNPAEQVTRTVHVVDTTPPTLTLIGDEIVFLECSVDTYTELGADFFDSCCITGPVLIGGDFVDVSTPDTYTITYSITDCAGNPAPEVTRTVIVQDTLPPVITLNGDDVVTLECGESYVEPGAQVTDDCCPGPLTIGGDIVDTTTPGTYTVTYDAEDCSGNFAKQVIRTVNVNPCNNPPIAENDSYSTDADKPLYGTTVLVNDNDPDGDPLTVDTTPVVNVQHCQLTLNPDGTFIYTPDPKFSGIDSFIYEVNDGKGGTDTATVYVHVLLTNDPPMAADDHYTRDHDALTWFDEVTLEQDSSSLVEVLANDWSLTGWELRILDVQQPWYGTVEIVHNTFGKDEILYTTSPGFCGSDQFTYRVISTDGNTLAVPAPGILRNDSDPNGDSIEPVLESQPSRGVLTLNKDGSFTYQPADGFFGVDKFQYRAHDGELYSDIAAVTIIVEEPTQEDVYVNVTCTPPVLSDCAGKVIISEVAWGGTPASSEDEWIELRNLGETPVDLAGWQLRWHKKQPLTPEEKKWTVVQLEGTIPGAPPQLNPCLREESNYVTRYYESPVRYAVGEAVPSEDPDKPFFLAERRHDETIYDVPSERAGLVYHSSTWPLEFPLFDEGAVIELLDSQGNVVDTANAYAIDNPMWPAGELFGRTMERIDPLGPDEPWNWRTNEGVIAFHQDAEKTPLFATSWEPNEPVIEWTKLPHWWTGQVASVKHGDLLPIILPIPSSTILERQLTVKVATSTEVLDVDVSSVSIVDGHILIDTTFLLPGEEYKVWIIPQPGLTVLVPFKLG